MKVTRDGKRRKLSTQEAALLRLREKALSGDARALDRLLSLAQTHNNEEPVAAASMSADDAVVFEVFKARVLSGAIGSSAPAQVNDVAAVSDSSSDFGARSADSPGDEPKIHTDNADKGETL